MPTAKQADRPASTNETVVPGISAVSTVVKRIAHRVHDRPDLGGNVSPIERQNVRRRHHDVLANAPSRSTPMMRVFLQIWLLPVRH